jgi:uncharacterized BrkB/YihY/UPF0761 family membrane protein
LNQVTAGKEPSVDTARPVGRSKRTYFIVITLLGLAIGAFPGPLSFELQQQVFNYYIGQSLASIQDLILIMDFVIFLVSPCLFFVTFYIFGKRTMQYFEENCLGVILILFLGSALGSGVYFLVTLFAGWGFPPIGEVALETMNRAFWGVFVGFSALGPSHFNFGSMPTVREQSLPV